MTKNHVIRRSNGNFSFRIAIPKALRHRFGGKTEQWEALNTNDRTVANAKAAARVLYWKNLFTPVQLPDETPVAAAIVRDIANSLGFKLHSPEDIHRASSTKDKIDMLAASCDALEQIAIPTRLEVAAMGGAFDQTLSLDQMFSRYEELCSGKWNDLSHRDRQKKWNRYREPVADFKREMGDLDVLKITTTDAANYAVNLGKRIESGLLLSETAKKKLLFLRAMIQRVFDADYPNRDNPFAKAKIDHSGNNKKSRLPFEEAEILALRNKLLEVNANEELKAIMKIAEFTGTSAKEIVLLHESDFFLDAEIPYLRFGPNPYRKSLKTSNRPREVPLIGEALEAARRFPQGFPRYRRSNGAEAWGAAANKIIKAVAPEKTTYCFRHRMIDLLRSAKTDEAIIKWIVGHDGSMTGKYGTGYPLDVKLEAINAAMAVAENRQKKLAEPDIKP